MGGVSVTARAVHIDTIHLSHEYRAADLPDVDEMLKRRLNPSVKEGKYGLIVNGYYKPFGKASPDPRIQVTRSDGGYCEIKVKVPSVGKILDGHGLNDQTDEDLACALDAISDHVRKVVGVEFDAETAKVHLLDANADFPVGEAAVAPFINAATCPDARLKMARYDTSVQFFNGSRKLSVYGKQAETTNRFRSGKAAFGHIAPAAGILRVEVRYARPESVRTLASRLGVSAVAGHLMTRGVAERMVAAALADLRLDRPHAASHDLDARLRDRFGSDAYKMRGVLEGVRRDGEVVARGVLGKDKFYRLKKRLEQAGVWGISPEGELPALGLEDRSAVVLKAA